jgi:MurNAc alpha-1-phosphate uridylyltransferase
MLEVAGRPFIDWQLERLAGAGVRDVVMCIAFLGDQIQSHVGDGSRLGLRVRWSQEGPKLLGTAGALRAALPLLAARMLVTYGDSYLPDDYAAPLRMLEAHDDCDGVMAIFKNEGRWDTSNVLTDGTWVLRYDKVDRSPAFDHIDYGNMALRREVVAGIPEGMPLGLHAVQQDLANRKRLRAYVARERFHEIGSPGGLAELDEYLRKRTP